jgi:FkbM family methyltransferase
MLSIYTISRSVLNTIWHDPSNQGERVKRLLYGVGWQLFKRLVGLPLIIKLDNGVEYIADPFSGNAVGAIYTRVYEAEYILFLRRFLTRDVPISLVDVGAHAGLFSLWLADIVEGGILFEPAQDNRTLLYRNIRLNHLDNKFTIRQEAVSNIDGEIAFHITGSFSGTNQIREIDLNQLNDQQRSDYKEVTVPVVKLDTVIDSTSQSDFVLGFLKIDTEGHDLQVLQGARNLLSGSLHAIALVENSNTLGIVDFFESINWKSFAISKSGKILTDVESLHSAYNILAVAPKHSL